MFSQLSGGFAGSEILNFRASSGRGDVLVSLLIHIDTADELDDKPELLLMDMPGLPPHQRFKVPVTTDPLVAGVR